MNDNSRKRLLRACQAALKYSDLMDRKIRLEETFHKHTMHGWHSQICSGHKPKKDTTNEHTKLKRRAAALKVEILKTQGDIRAIMNNGTEDK